jgi:C-8 sterol isomerase
MSYIFDPKVLEKCAKVGEGQPLEERFPLITDELVRIYGKHVNPNFHWFFNNAGGAMGTMTLLHASLTEYLIFFGSAVGTEGHSGRYKCDIYDFMLEGEMWCYHEDEVRKQVYRPDTRYALLANDKAKGYKIPETGGWMLEYCRGNIPSMLPFGLADTLLSTLDVKTLWTSLRLYGTSVVRELSMGKI